MVDALVAVAVPVALHVLAMTNGRTRSSGRTCDWEVEVTGYGQPQGRGQG